MMSALPSIPPLARQLASGVEQSPGPVYTDIRGYMSIMIAPMVLLAMFLDDPNSFIVPNWLFLIPPVPL